MRRWRWRGCSRWRDGAVPRYKGGHPFPERLAIFPGPNEARSLFDTVSSYRGRGARLFDVALAPAMPAWSGFAATYARYRRLASAPGFSRGEVGGQADLWTFYALSRVFEHLILGIQDSAAIGRLYTGWPAQRFPSPSSDELVRFFGALGMERMSTHPRYHPFFQEVAAAELDPGLGARVLVEEELWPGLWFGDLVFARAGVRVRCGPAADVDPVIATCSTLYFAWLRIHRRVSDLSHGWGQSSQWATDFRRDYIDGDTLHYNVDGHVSLNSETDNFANETPSCGRLTIAERIELLTHRCFVHSATPSHDHWPFNDTYAEPARGPDSIW